TPVSVMGANATALLSTLASVGRTTTPGALNHYNVQPVFDALASVQGTDRGNVADKVAKVADEFRGRISKASTITLRGQVHSRREEVDCLGRGIAFALLIG